MTQAESAQSSALLVQAEAGRGFAAQNNTAPADILAIVTDPTTGVGIANLTQSNFQVIGHFSNPGQTCGFSNNITLFNDVGTGAYQIQVALRGCNWVRGDFLIQVIVSMGQRSGQATAKFSVI